MSPCELNAVIAALSNHFYATLSPREFTVLSVFLSLLSKQMFAIIAMKDICDRDDRITLAEAVD